ncbi:MAG: succinyl-diaminopimelate desuccinylase [Beggiatoa sp. IS2]|nr:MAG: succinyl-diaminopimelate desuccinylase [Beggiatoa sp. IS2]
MSTILELAIDLISRPSVTPNDAGCQRLIAQRLEPLGFCNEHLRFGEVDNLWARHGNTAPLFVFAGHTDVVPTGPLTAWQFPPFTPTVQDGFLYGRGAADMKGSLAAMVVACERFVTQYPQHRGSIAVLLTSDEEGPAVDGTVKVVQQLQARGESIEWCLVAEPASCTQIGDEIKVGRRGSLTGRLRVHGIQGHVAYPHLADNPLHRLAPALDTLCQTIWDSGNEFFPATTFQVTNIHAGTGADNVIPNEADVLFNFRYGTVTRHTELQQRVKAILDQYHLNYDLTWQHSGLPFLTKHGALIAVTQQIIREVCGYETRLSTAGGTSDGRFIAPTGAQVLELGPLNATIHKINECVRVDHLDTLAILYLGILEKLFIDNG